MRIPDHLSYQSIKCQYEVVCEIITTKWWAIKTGAVNIHYMRRDDSLINHQITRAFHANELVS